MITPIYLFLMSILLLLVMILSIGIIAVYKIDVLIYELSSITIIKENKKSKG